MEHPEKVPDCSLYQAPTYPENVMKIRTRVFSVMLLTDRQTNETAIGDCIFANISQNEDQPVDEIDESISD